MKSSEAAGNSIRFSNSCARLREVRRSLAVLIFSVAMWACQGLTDPSSKSVKPTQPSNPTYFGIQVAAGRWIGPGGLASMAMASPSQYVAEVKFALERTPGPWSLGSDGRTGTVMPNFTSCTSGSLRQSEAYICAAMVSAFAVEYAGRIGDLASANDYGHTLDSSLRSAYALCSFVGLPTFGGATPSQIEMLMPCADLRSLFG